MHYRRRSIRRVTPALLTASLVFAAIGLSAPGPAPGQTTASPAGRLADVKGQVTLLGDAAGGGDLRAVALRMPVIAVVDRQSGPGYWMAALDGGVFSFGGAPFYGSLGGTRLNQPIVDMAVTPSGRGYWLVAADGGVFTFGDARFLGSLGSVRLNQPIAGMAVTLSGRGYWLVAADGGVFSFGDARFFGSGAATTSNVHVATIAATRTSRGYWLLDRAGRVRAFGDARAYGGIAGGDALAVGMVPSPSGSGYWIATADGSVQAFGDATTFGSLAHSRTATVGLATRWGSSSGIALPLIEFLAQISVAAPPVLRRTWVDAHQVALTFDDGPGSYTPQVLAVLAYYGVPATFFAVGYEVGERPDLVRAEIAAGMAVGDHAWDHADLTRLPLAEVDDELQRGADAIVAATGYRPTCFRPPYGATNSTVAAAGARLGMSQILWNVDPSDYLRPGAPVIAARVLGAANGRGLVVGIHDGGGDRSQTIAALPAIISGLRERGYTFVRLC
jgi:peptidoglycan/xylan/chitin deacetylase (PgdA/CDA1 family)